MISVYTIWFLDWQQKIKTQTFFIADWVNWILCNYDDGLIVSEYVCQWPTASMYEKDDNDDR